MDTAHIVLSLLLFAFTYLGTHSYPMAACCCTNLLHHAYIPCSVLLSLLNEGRCTWGAGIQCTLQNTSLQLALSFPDQSLDINSLPGTLLLPGACHAFTLSFSSKLCSGLLLEWWGLNADGSPVDSLTNIPGIYFLAAQGSSDPMVCIFASVKHCMNE
jgi:hypothetical protein